MKPQSPLSHVDSLVLQIPVVQKGDSAIHQINLYPVDSAIAFPNTYPLDNDLSGASCCPAFEQLGPELPNKETVFHYL